MLFPISRIALIFAAAVSLASAGLDKVDRPVSGVQKGLVVAVDFSDSPLHLTNTQVANFYNQPGYAENGNSGSVRDYYLEVSNGTVDFNHQVVRYTALQQVGMYYGQEYNLFFEVLNHLSAQGFNFSQLSKHTKDVTLRSFIMVVRGADFVTSFKPFSHSGPGTVQHSGFVIQGVGPNGLTLSHAAHELGHMAFYWPDLYDYATGSASQGLGTFCMYGSNHLMPGNPVRINPFLMGVMGWANPVPLLGSSQLTLNAGTSSVYKIPNPDKAGEYFLLEARVRQGRSAGLPGEGVALWHVDEAQWDNVWYHWDANEHNEMLPDAHYTVGLVQADGAHDLEGLHNTGEQKDLFGPAAGLQFSDLKGFDGHWWSGSNSGFSFGDVTRNGNQFMLNYTVSTNAAIGTLSGPQSLSVPQGSTGSLPVNIANTGTTAMLNQAAVQSPSYTVANSDQPGGPPFVWQSIKSVSTYLAPDQQNPESRVVALPFAFPFYGKSFTSMNVFNKTTIAFGTSTINHNQATLPSPLMPPSLITPFCAFVIPDQDDSVFVQSFADKVVVEWYNVTQKRRPDASSIALMSVQVVLFKDGGIRFYYNNFTPYSSEAMTAGIQDETQRRGISTGTMTGSVHAGLAVAFIRNRAPVSAINETITSLNGGQSRALSLTVNAATLPVGTYKDTLLVNHNGRNLPSPIVVPFTVTVTPNTGKPDLVVSDIQWTPASILTGNKVRFSAVITNQGTAPTPAGVTHGVGFWVNGGFVTYSDNTNASLAPGASRTVTASGPAGNGGLWTATAGAHSVQAFVDDVNRIPNESNESNNKRTESFTVANAQPDLIVTAIGWIPANPVAGQQVQFTATIKNQGTAATPAVIHGVGFKVNGTSVSWSDNTSASLAAGASRTVTANWGPNNKATWTAAKGTHSVQAIVDDVNRIPGESNETNNSLAKSLIVP